MSDLMEVPLGKTKYVRNRITVSCRFPILLATPLYYIYVIIEELTNHCVEAGMLNFQLDLPFLEISIVKIYQ